MLHVLEFDSVRKRMSVIVRTPGNMIKLFCKGADKVIFERLQDLVPEEGTKLQRKIRQDTKAHLDSFARQGLRTLCCAEAVIPNNVYEQWKKVYQDADTSMQNRKEKLSEAANLIEKNLLLLGASAIEDKLQENVIIQIINKNCREKILKFGGFRIYLFALLSFTFFITMILLIKNLIYDFSRSRKLSKHFSKPASQCGC